MTEHDAPTARRSAIEVAAATAAFAAVHSALAGAGLKDAVERRVGTRARDALYRPAYNLVAFAMVAALVAFILRRPTRTLYRVRGPAAGAMRLGQAAALAWVAAAAWATGPAGFLGLPGLWAWLLRRPHVPREPAAQGPARRPDGTVAADGPFARSRQPANAALVPLFALNPRMTANLAAFTLVTAAYAVVGAMHSESLLRREYGEAYDHYRRTGVPLFVPRPGRRAR